MATHHLCPGPETVRGYLTRDLPPILTIDSGDRLCCQTLDAAWGALEQTFPLTEAKEFSPRAAGSYGSAGATSGLAEELPDESR
jgi:hypothetical protein